MNSNTEEKVNNSDSKEEEKEITQSIAKALRNRDRALRELVETEKTYVNGLAKLIIIYMNPLKQNDYKTISISDHQTIFPCVVNIIYNLHNQLLAELDYNYYHYDTAKDGNESITSRIGKVLIKYVELFKMYQIYMNGYERAQKALSILKKKNRRFNKWLSLQLSKTSITAGDLENLLILPIQRLPRYQLLLKEIIKQTEKIPMYHNDLSDLRHTYTQILDITRLIETKMKEYDNKQKVANIERKFSNIAPGVLVKPARYYITESRNTNHEIIRIHNGDSSSHNIILFLFNDSLIYGHFNEEYSSTFMYNSNKLHFDHTLVFDNLFKCVVEDNYKPKSDYKYLHCLKIYSRDYSIWISFKTKKLRQKWLKLINNANDSVNNKYLKNLQRFNEQKNNNENICKNAKEKQMFPYPCFVPDDYTHLCQECSAKFTYISNRKHHCKQCGRLLCKQCTNYRINSVFYNKNNHKNKIIRCCKQCKDQNTFAILSCAENVRKYPKNNTKYDHGYNRHMQIYNRIHRTNSTPSIKSPRLKPLRNESGYSSAGTTQQNYPKLVKKASAPLLLSASHTSMFVKSPKIRAMKMNDSLSGEEEKSVSIDLENSLSMDVSVPMPTLDISETNSNVNNSKEMKRKRPRRSRSYAVGLLNETEANSYVGCVITDDEECVSVEYENALFTDQLLVSSGCEAPSSGESKDSPFFRKERKAKIYTTQRHSSFRESYAGGPENALRMHCVSRSLGWL